MTSRLARSLDDGFMNSGSTCSRVGNAYQADIPKWQGSDNFEEPVDQFVGIAVKEWDPDNGRVSRDSNLQFLSNLDASVPTDLALKVLHSTSYDIDLANKQLELIGQPCDSTSKVPKLSTVSMSAFARHGRKFGVIRDELNTTMKHVIALYYKWKCTNEYRIWKQSAREMQATSGIADFHNEVCETCSKEGDLLCCDTCSLAYHLQCVEPPLDDYPSGDWSCGVCEAEFTCEKDRTTAKKFVETSMKRVQSRREAALTGGSAAMRDSPDQRGVSSRLLRRITRRIDTRPSLSPAGQSQSNAKERRLMECLPPFDLRGALNCYAGPGSTAVSGGAWRLRRAAEGEEVPKGNATAISRERGVAEGMRCGGGGGGTSGNTSRLFQNFQLRSSTGGGVKGVLRRAGVKHGSDVLLRSCGIVIVGGGGTGYGSVGACSSNTSGRCEELVKRRVVNNNKRRVVSSSSSWDQIEVHWRGADEAVVAKKKKRRRGDDCY